MGSIHPDLCRMLSIHSRDSPDTRCYDFAVSSTKAGQLLAAVLPQEGDQGLCTWQVVAARFAAAEFALSFDLRCFCCYGQSQRPEGSSPPAAPQTRWWRLWPLACGHGGWQAVPHLGDQKVRCTWDGHWEKPLKIRCVNHEMGKNTHGHLGAERNIDQPPNMNLAMNRLKMLKFGEGPP